MWFSDKINIALNKSKQEKLVLLVYLEGDDEKSKLMTTFLESDQNIVEIIEKKTVGLKLKAESTEAKMFLQIYPSKPAPCIYVISHNGKLLDCFSESIDKENFLRKVNNLVKSESNDSNEKSESDSNSQASSSKIEKEDKNKMMLEKIEKLKLEIKEKNAKAELEKNKKLESDRIKTGKELQKLKKRNEEQELLEMIKEKEKDAILDKIEREKVLAQIKEDHEERKIRFEKERILREKEMEKLKKEKTNQIKNRDIKLEENEMKLQFRLPDTNVLISKFKVDDQLSTAVNYVKENSSYRNFILALTYPKKNFNESDFNKKFNELGIENSSVLLVIENSVITKKTEQVQYTIFSRIWDFVYSVLYYVFGYFYNLISPFLTKSNNQVNQNENLNNESDVNQDDKLS